MTTLNFKRRLELPEDFIPLASTADIMFLLMIFFLVTTTFTAEKEKGINMQLPDTVVQEEIPSENVAVTVDRDDRVLLDGREIKVEEVGRLVKEKLSAHPERFVVIKSDQTVKYGKVVDVLDELFQAGIHNIALPTEKETIEEKPAGRP